MNRKETLIWSIIDNVIIACDIPRADGTHSISREDIVGMLICVVKEFKSIGMNVGNINNYYSLL